MTHLYHCFTHFALNHIAVGNGILTGETLAELKDNLASDNPCLSAYASAFHAVNYLLSLKHTLKQPLL